MKRIAHHLDSLLNLDFLCYFMADMINIKNERRSRKGFFIVIVLHLLCFTLEKTDILVNCTYLYIYIYIYQIIITLAGEEEVCVRERLREAKKWEVICI